MRYASLLVILPVLLSTACARVILPAAEAAGSERVDPNVLTAEQISNFGDAHAAVQGLRSNWLRRRAPGDFQSTGQVWVYRDGVRLGDVETLRRMPTVEIASIQYYDGIAASQRWGLGHENGVILVASRAR